MRALGALGALLLLACGASADLPRPLTPLSATPDEAFRRDPPRVDPPGPFRPPQLLVDRLPNGLTLIHMPRQGAGLAALRLVTRAGEEALPAATAGLAWMTAETLERETQADPAWQDLADRHGTEVDVGASFAAAMVSVTLTHDQIPAALEHLARLVRAPAFRDEDVEAAREEALRTLRDHWHDPGRQSETLARRILFGSDHRMGHPVWGEDRIVRSFTRLQLQAYHQQAWRPEGSALVVVGEIDHASLLAQVTGLLGDWRAPGPPPAPASEVFPPLGLPGRVLIVPARISQAWLVLADRAPAYGTVDTIPYELLSTVLGGSAISRLHRLLREEQGYTYGVGADYTARAGSGDVFLATNVAPRRLRFVLRAIVDELRRLRDSGPTAEELEWARTTRRERLIAAFDESDSAAGTLAGLFVSGAPPDDLLRSERLMREVELGHVRAAARRWMRPDDAPFVVIGAESFVSPAVNAAGLGVPLRFRSTGQ